MIGTGTRLLLLLPLPPLPRATLRLLHGLRMLLPRLGRCSCRHVC